MDTAVEHASDPVTPRAVPPLASAANPDFTQGSIVAWIGRLAVPTAVGMLAQLAYQLIDLYFVVQLGANATAGVNAAGNVILTVNALTQVLSVGTVALVAHAIGRHDMHDVRHVFAQSLGLGCLGGLVYAALGFMGARYYVASVAREPAVIEAGVTFLCWILPGYALMLPMAAAGAALRGSGRVRAPIAIYCVTLAVNAVLAPVLIAGWGTHAALGVRGAGLATSFSVLVGLGMLLLYLQRSGGTFQLTGLPWRPDFGAWMRLLRVGLPAGGEFVLLFFTGALTYATLEEFGAQAQAGFGIGWRVLQALLLPALAVALAAVPIVGQNVGAQQRERVGAIFRTLVVLELLLMGGLTLLVQLAPHALVQGFDTDAATREIAARYLEVLGWSFLAQGIVYAGTALFQGLGHTSASFASSAMRFLLFAGGAWFIARTAASDPATLWSLLVMSVAGQALFTAVLASRALRT